MTDTGYLESLLAEQKLADDSAELEELRTHRKDVEALLLAKFSESSPTIRYAGSIAKGTLIRESYDLDMTCFFPYDDTKAGETLKDTYHNVRKVLEEKYLVEAKTSALRLRSKEQSGLGRDLHIDVVPGRFTDESKTDCFIHQEGAEKERLKTNLQVHIDHVKGSGVLDALRLLKLWKVRRALRVKQFTFELLGIKLLEGRKGLALDAQLKHVWQKIADSQEAIAIEDPANPKGNDLMPFLRAVWPELNSAVANTLRTLENSGWEAVFGALQKRDGARVDRLAAAAAAVTHPTRPYAASD